MTPPPYFPRFTESFQECIQNHPNRQKRIRNHVSRVLSDPYGGGHWLTRDKADLRGKRGRHDAAGQYVLIYMICRECLASGYRDKGYNNCDPCEGNEANVVFLAYGLHDETYAAQWEEVLAAQAEGE